MRLFSKVIIALVVVGIVFSLISANLSAIIPIRSVLFPGCKGSEVLELETKLKAWGYFNEFPDQSYDFNTAKAVYNYQKEYGLRSSGIANADTLYSIGMVEINYANWVDAATKGTSQVQLLARAINGEARGEPYNGQVGVGAVILNRVKNSKFPKTVAGVIYQPGAFTAVADGQINHPINPKSSVVKAASSAQNGWDPTSGSIYYWNPATATSKWIWSRKIIKKIGKHYFGK